MSEHTYVVRWPIVDMRTPLSDLLGTAMQDIARELTTRLLRQAAPVEWAITRDHAGMVLVATVPVTVPDRVDEPDPPGARRNGRDDLQTRESIHELFAMGETHAAIASRLGISEAAVDRARYRRRAS